MQLNFALLNAGFACSFTWPQGNHLNEGEPFIQTILIIGEKPRREKNAVGFQQINQNSRQPKLLVQP